MLRNFSATIQRIQQHPQILGLTGGYVRQVRIDRYPRGPFSDPFAANDTIEAGEVLKATRAWVDLTQTELSRRTGIPQQTISAWERGRQEPPFTAVMRIIGACGLDLVVGPTAREFDEPLPARVKLLGPAASAGGPADVAHRTRRLRRAQLRQYALERRNQTTN